MAEENKKLETLKKLEPLSEFPVKSDGKQLYIKTPDRVGDNPNKMVIGSGTSFKGSDINTDSIEIYGKVETSVRAKVIYVGTSAEIIGSVSCDQIEIHGSVSGAIEAKGKVSIKKSATVVGTLRYQSVCVDEGANIYSDLHCTNADQPLLDKISKLKKTMTIINSNIANAVENKLSSESDKSTSKLEKESKKKRSFFS